MFLPRLSERIKEGEVAAGIVLGIISVSVGMLNAASMTF
jgi:putative membrane protein